MPALANPREIGGRWLIVFDKRGTGMGNSNRTPSHGVQYKGAVLTVAGAINDTGWITVP
jgi:hypothetical protein